MEFDDPFGLWRYGTDARVHHFVMGNPLCHRPIGPPGSEPDRYVYGGGRSHTNNASYRPHPRCPECVAAFERMWAEMYPPLEMATF